MKTFLKIAALSIIFILLGFLFFSLGYFFHSKPKFKGKVSLKGLTADVRIITDNWGVPHVFTQNERDLFFACGYVHAKERMWQMDLLRRAGFGRLSEILGKVTLEKDKFMRNLGLKEAAWRDFEKLSSKMKDNLLSYSIGVNAWMNSRKLNWPPEFLILRYRPEPWTPMDSLIIKEIMALLLCMDYPSEVVRANLVKRLGAKKALEILEEDIKNSPPITENASLSEWMRVFLSQGSNNWVIAGSRTESGKPLLANDPHLEISLPPIWYEIHLNCPTINVIGVSIPGMPLVIIGHNESIAWGITNSAADVQDLYIEKINPQNDMYLEEVRWKPLLKKEEIIRVRGKKNPVRLEINWTSHGPIISPLIIESDASFSLRWTIYKGGRTFEAVYLLNKAQNWKDFSKALRLFDTPSQNFVYADKEGNIGYYLTGKIPIRAEDAALFPFPSWLEKGSWQGFLDEAKKPNLYNPEEGMIITANNKIIPDDFPYYVSVDWDVSFRADRIKELLLQRDKHNIESFKKIQNDVFSKKGELFLPLLKRINEAEGNLKKALAIIKDWDLQMATGKGPALFSVFMNFFHEEVFSDELGEDFKSFDLLFRRKQAGLLRILSDPFSSWFDKRDTTLIDAGEDIAKISIERAYEWLEQNYGFQDDWDWGKMHTLHFQHVLGQMPLFSFFNRGTYPVKGNAFTVMASFSTDYRTTHGASYRQIIDLSDFGNSICVLTSGQSGHFLSQFYDDQIPLWLEGRYHPMLFYSEDIEAKAAGVLLLKSLSKEES
ncbi:MAG: penicillin acylase family protein [Candidatus Aminicenantes bacterium]|nr:penicillin acylase family protein [Candidatus Aminicenantes bacterium]